MSKPDLIKIFGPRVVLRWTEAFLADLGADVNDDQLLLEDFVLALKKKHPNAKFSAPTFRRNRHKITENVKQWFGWFEEPAICGKKVVISVEHVFACLEHAKELALLAPFVMAPNAVVVRAPSPMQKAKRAIVGIFKGAVGKIVTDSSLDSLDDDEEDDDSDGDPLAPEAALVQYKAARQMLAIQSESIGKSVLWILIIRQIFSFHAGGIGEIHPPTSKACKLCSVDF